ncbi:MAG: patatin-like phospholipase family protein [Beijerinckiaceae bacterium]
MFEAVSFPGGGNRCYWQGGFWESAAPALGLAPQRVVGVSGGALAAAYSVLGLGPKVRALVIEGCRRGLPNIEWRALARGGDAFPVAPMYRALLDEVLDENAFAAIRAATDLRIMIARPPRGWPGSIAAMLGLASYQIEKKLFGPVHPRWGAKLGFTANYISVRSLPNARAWVDVTFASASVPPIIRLQRIDGKPALDGGMADNVPIEPLKEIEAQGGRTLVLLTRRYNRIPDIANRLYVQPSEKIGVGQFDITRPDGIIAAYELGLRDGAAFATSQR